MSIYHKPKLKSLVIQLHWRKELYIIKDKIDRTKNIEAIGNTLYCTRVKFNRHHVILLNLDFSLTLESTLCQNSGE